MYSIQAFIRNELARYGKTFGIILAWLMICACLCGFNGRASAQLYDLDDSGNDTCDALHGGLRKERTCFDVKFYRLELELDIAAHSLVGVNTMRFEVKESTTSIQLDLHNELYWDSVVWHGMQLPFIRKCKAVFVDFPEALQNERMDSLQIYYHGSPVEAAMAPWDGGFVWSADESNQPWIGVACQGMGASTWWPCKDHPSDEPDSMDIFITIPDSLQAVCNGTERESIMLAGHRRRFHWHISYPINTYNVTLNVAAYDHWNDKYISSDGDTLALDYYVLPNHREKAEHQFSQVKPMLSCYEKYLGKYPFYVDGYALVETPYLGMEHQGAIAYGNQYLNGYLGGDRSGCGLDFDYIIIHETGHEWWGNSVSAGDLADMWIHESFCTYTEAIYVEHFYGYDTAMRYVNALKRSVMNTSPIIGTYGFNREGHSDMYVKGMLFLNTLRHVVNDDERWWKTIKYVSDTLFRLHITDYRQVVEAFDRFPGIDVAEIFEQYVKLPSIPVLEFDVVGRKSDRILRYRWTATQDGFSMPLDLQIGSRPVRIYPENDWKEMPIGGEVHWWDDQFYVRYKEKS
jgi:aminopeptidase N